jgi:hypothetical protein
MKIKNTISALILLVTFSCANEEGGKFLVLDNTTFDTIDKLNILNGGIKKKVVISSVRLKEEDLLQFYPEYFLFTGEKCSIINNIETTNSNNNNNMVLLDRKDDLLKEVKKIKLLQLVNDYIDSDVMMTSISKELIQSAGVICEKRLLLRGRYYKINDTLSSLKIKSIDVQNSTLLIEE